MIRGRVSGVDLARVSDDHPVEWLRGRQVVEVASPGVEGLATGDPVVLLIADQFTDVEMLIRLARGSSWPGGMAHRVEVAATRILGGES